MFILLIVVPCSCTFDMSKVEIYSVLVTLDATNKWQLDGYKHHSVTGIQHFCDDYQLSLG